MNVQISYLSSFISTPGNDASGYEVSEILRWCVCARAHRPLEFTIKQLYSNSRSSDRRGSNPTAEKKKSNSSVQPSKIQLDM